MESVSAERRDSTPIYKRLTRSALDFHAIPLRDLIFIILEHKMCREESQAFVSLRSTKYPIHGH
jgi:hypothetical protein